MAMSMNLAAHQLTLAYGEKVVAPDMSIAFDKPEIVGIIGPNGSGKSTLLKALSHLIRPVAGQVLLQGQLQGQPSTLPMACSRPNGHFDARRYNGSMQRGLKCRGRRVMELLAGRL